MGNTSDINDGGPIIGLNRVQIIQAWNQGKNLRQIAIETGIPIQKVNTCIKEIEKAVIRPGVKSHAKKNS
jgi:predicted transcriptional regulator